MADKLHIGGVTNTTLHLETDGTLHIEEWQDCQPTLDYAEAARNRRFSGSVLGGDAYHVAELPMVEYINWCREAGVAMFSNEAAIVVEKKLQDPAYARFLAAPVLRDPRIVMKGAR